MDTSTPLAGVGEPSLDYTPTTGTIPPGYQLIVDFDDDGTIDGILVGEPTVYGNDWWLNNGAEQFVKDGRPHTPAAGPAAQLRHPRRVACRVPEREREGIRLLAGLRGSG